MTNRFSSCPCCGNTTLKEHRNSSFKAPSAPSDFFYGGWKYIKNLFYCSQCGFRYIGELTHNYQDFYQSFGNDDEGYATANVKRMRYFKDMIANLEKSGHINFKNFNRALDIGSGDGLFLYSLPSNIKKTDVEPSPKLQEKLSSNGIEVADDLSHISKETKFDLITLNDFLEHVEKPDEFLKQLISLLEPHGTILISVPDYSRILAKLFPSKYYLTTPMHFSYFTWESMRLLVKKQNGIELITMTKAPSVYAELGDALKWLKIKKNNPLTKYLGKIPIGYRSNFITVLRKGT